MFTARRTLMGVAGYFGATHLGKALIGFNSQIETAKNQIAGMLALTKKTSMADQLGVASKLYDELRVKAAELPGEVEEYVNMMTMIVRPLSDAGFNVEEIRDMTVSAVVAAKGLGESWQVAGRDIDEATMGKFGVVDKFSRKVLESLGPIYQGTEGRARFKALSKEQRAREFQRGLKQPQFQQMGEAAGQSFSGQMDKTKEAVKQFLGAVGLPLFKELGDAIKRVNIYLAAHQKQVTEVATVVGGALLDAFRAVGKVIMFIVEHESILRMILIMITMFAAKAVVVWTLVNARLLFMTTLIWAAIEAFRYLKEKIGFVLAAVVALGAAAAISFAHGMAGKLITALIVKMYALATATNTAAAAAARYSVAGMGLGPAGVGKGGIGQAGKGVGGGGLMGFLGPAGLAVGGAVVANEMSGGSLSDSLMNRLLASTDLQMSGGEIGKKSMGTEVTVGSTTINIFGAKDAADVKAQIEGAHEDIWTRTLRQAQRAAGGK